MKTLLILLAIGKTARREAVKDRKASAVKVLHLQPNVPRARSPCFSIDGR